MIRDLQVMITKHRRTFTLNKNQHREVVVDRRSKPDAHRSRFSKILPHYAVLQPKLALRHQ